MNLESRLDNMGFLNFFKKDKGLDEPDMSRREFLSNTGKLGIGAAAAYVTGGALNTAQAASQVPDAIKAEAREFNDDALYDAWYDAHNKRNIDFPGGKVDSIIMAKRILGLIRGPTYNGETIKDDTMHNSYGYALLISKLGFNDFNPSRSSRSWDDRMGLLWFNHGVCEMYGEKNNYMARLNFAKGIFAAAQLGPQDYQRMRQAGVPVEFEGNSIQQNAQRLGEQFKEAPLQTKEIMLNVGIGQKRLTHQQQKGVFWNLGFYIMSENLLGNANKMRRLDRQSNKDNSSLYGILYQRTGYDTIHPRLLN